MEIHTASKYEMGRLYGEVVSLFLRELGTLLLIKIRKIVKA